MKCFCVCVVSFSCLCGLDVNILCTKFDICSPLYVISSAFFNICSEYVLMGSQNFVGCGALFIIRRLTSFCGLLVTFYAVLAFV